MFQNSLYRVVYCIRPGTAVHFTHVSFRTRSIESFTASCHPTRATFLSSIGFRTRSIESFTASTVMFFSTGISVAFQNSLYRVVYCIADRRFPRSCSQRFRTRSIESFTASCLHLAKHWPLSCFRTRSIESFTASPSLRRQQPLYFEFQNSLYRVVYCINASSAS